MSNFLLLVDASNDIISEITAEKEIVYSFTGGEEIETGDRIIVCVDHPINQFRMILEATRPSEDGKAYFIKQLEVLDGVDFVDYPEAEELIYRGKASSKNVIKVSESITYEIVKGIVNKVSSIAGGGSTVKPITYCTGLKSEYLRNRIIFGAPGTGKSFMVNAEKDNLLSLGGEYERVTFHPDYTYANFVGTYKPVPSVDNKGNDVITYEYVPGPFMRTLVKALDNGRKDAVNPYLLIIEEINRANVAAVFGEIFQLLDRVDNVSEYPIQTSEDVRKYLAKELGGLPSDYETIQIPDNMFIWATMNSADQGVFPMDTAFKRRWDFTYLSINKNDDEIIGEKIILGSGPDKRVVEWNELRKAINEELVTAYKINEDKLLGTFFIPKDKVPGGKKYSEEEFKEIFKNKVIMYLFEDAARQKAPTLFGGCKKRLYSEICDAFDTMGVNIFCDNIRNKFTTNEE